MMEGVRHEEGGLGRKSSRGLEAELSDGMWVGSWGKVGLGDGRTLLMVERYLLSLVPLRKKQDSFL